jgi:hypothetical protein
MGAAGFGTRISGGDIPIASGDTAWRATGCTNAAGIRNENYEAEIAIPGLGTISGLKTRVWTTKKNGVVSSNASHSIADLTLLETALGKLQLTGISSRARAYNDGERFRAETFTKVLGLRYTPPNGDPVNLDLPTPGAPITVPGVLRVSIGKHLKKVGSSRAYARASGLLVELFPTNTIVRVASSRATIASGVRAGLMSGYSAGLRADVLDPIVNVGRTPLLVMPCVGTKGKVQTRGLANVNIPGVLEVGAAQTSQMAIQTDRGGRGWEQAKVAEVELLDGAVVIEGITAKANVIRRGRKVIRNARGTETVRVTVQGEEVTLPDVGKLEIPGLLSIDQKVIERTPKSIKVIALQVKLLDGSGATIDLGIASFKITRAVHRRR